MKHKTISLVLACLIAVPLLYADNTETEVEIQLYELFDAGFIGGDDPLGDPSQTGNHPTPPNDFHATIAGRTLSVMTDVTSSTRVIVRNSTGTQVVNRLFVGGTMEQLSAGSYSIEIQSGSLTLVGQFSAH